MHEQRGVALFTGRAARLRQPRQPQGGFQIDFMDASCAEWGCLLDCELANCGSLLRGIALNRI